MCVHMSVCVISVCVHLISVCVCVCVYASECVCARNARVRMCVHNANACVKYKKNDNVCVRFN